MDWVTLLIELVGIVITLMWVFIPIGEFRQILQRVRHKRQQSARGEQPRP
jgi:hypothetical protein